MAYNTSLAIINYPYMYIHMYVYYIHEPSGLLDINITGIAQEYSHHPTAAN